LTVETNKDHLFI